MPMHITVDQAATWGTNQILGREKASAARKREVFAVKKYNLLVTAFNSSTVLLVVAVAAAVLFAYPAAFTFGAIGLFIRATTEKELEKYTFPLASSEKDMMQKLFEAVSKPQKGEKEANIFKRLKVDREDGWEIDEVVLFDHPIWKNKIQEPR